ncbi:hypothetical protein Adt_39470 [Abeliophyllum distichum]|uniref:Uncharacterized protein n=1 Tax=Abeliophyllum distichum TaxID=126358 RepID=A0ABD1Q557_9LAMI
MNIAHLFGISLTTPFLPLSVLVYWRTPLVRSYKVNTDKCVKDRFVSGRGLLWNHQVSMFVPFSLHMASALFWRPSSGLFLMVSFLLKGLYYKIYRLRLTLLWPFTASPEVEDLGLFRPLFATSDVSLPSTVILFFIFIMRATRWMTYLLKRVGIVVAILSTALRTYCDATAT